MNQQQQTRQAALVFQTGFEMKKALAAVKDRKNTLGWTYSELTWKEYQHVG